MKEKLCLLYLSIIVTLIPLISCQTSPEIVVSFQNKDSELVPLLLSKESLDAEWEIIKIFNTQSNQPFSSEAFKGIEEIATIAFWAYYDDNTQDVFLIDHTLYKYTSSPSIPNNLVNNGYKYTGSTDNGIKKYIRCETFQNSIPSGECKFALIKNTLVSILSILANNTEDIQVIDTITLIATPFLVDIESKLSSSD